MNIGATPMDNAANLSMFMVNLFRRQKAFSQMSVLDLKACFKACKYVWETLKPLQQMAEHDFISRATDHVSRGGGFTNLLPLHRGEGIVTSLPHKNLRTMIDVIQ